jgi:dolichyl-phosphate-mannose-protein mannosyltransferase
VRLPEWGFDQQEVTCITEGKVPKTLWYIETNENNMCKFFFFFSAHTQKISSLLFSIVPPDTEKTSYHKPGFFGKFVELNKVMWRTNQGLTSTHPYDSRPEVSKSLVKEEHLLQVPVTHQYQK